MRGHSKEKRADCKLVTLALVVDERGFAKYSRLYPGNQADGHTLPHIVESLVALRPNLAKDRTVVIDAGIFQPVHGRHAFFHGQGMVTIAMIPSPFDFIFV
ncbi:MAG TPA: hypothetical protein ENO00_05925 [Deltaproteobacteria bacterium]|nr:hypothetical protein [Deltaproteobacteria bacterium]